MDAIAMSHITHSPLQQQQTKGMKRGHLKRSDFVNPCMCTGGAAAGRDLTSGISWAVTQSRTCVDRNVTFLTRLSRARDQPGFCDRYRPAAQALDHGQGNVCKLTTHPRGERTSRTGLMSVLKSSSRQGE